MDDEPMVYMLDNQQLSDPDPYELDNGLQNSDDRNMYSSLFPYEI